MKKYPIMRRLLCSGLSVAMLISSQFSAFAATADSELPQTGILSSTDFSNTINDKEELSTTNSEDTSTNLSTTQNNSEEVSSKNNNSSLEEIKQNNPSSDSNYVSDAEVDNNESEVEEEANADASDKDFEDEPEDKTFNVKKGDFYISAFVPAEAFEMDVDFKADQIELSTSEEKLLDETVSDREVEKYFAFDLRFETDGEEIEPKEGSRVKISIEASSLATDTVVHIKDDETAETMESTVSEDKVSFEAESFSTYVIAEAPKKLGKKDFYDNLIYGSASANREHTPDNYTINDGFNKNRIALRIYHQNDDRYAPVELAPNDGGKCFIYGSDKNENFTFTFKAPENYYIAKVSLYDYYGEDYYKNNPRQVVNVNGYRTECNVDLTLRRMSLYDKVVNAVVVDYKPMPSHFTGPVQYVPGATFINYKNGNETGKPVNKENRTFGEQFMFGSGQTGSQSNHCSYGQVYQGLAAADITNGIFRLSNSNGAEFFPNYNYYSYVKWAAANWRNVTDSYSYITNYYNDARVQFNLDSDGYWTIDSSNNKYVFNQNYNTLVTTSGTQFRPFNNEKGDYADNHFGMMLPINFSVGEDGLSDNGKETVFKFFGDDDVFVYVDGRLVLDLGGIHDAVKGQINFKTGEILIQGDRENQLTSSYNNTCYVNDNGRVAKGIGTTNLYDLIPESDVRELSQKEHVLTVVYFERGAHDSNCKISFNFTKTETRTVDFSGLKVDENKKGLANAEFTLYTDEACTDVATMGIGVPAVAASDETGTITFTGLSAGVIPKGASSITRTYYMKETKAPEDYVTPEGALWKIEFTAYADESIKPNQKLYALNSQAQALSLDRWDNGVYQPNTNVIKIKNNPEKFAKKLNVTKKVLYGTDSLLDTDALYVFRIDQAVNGIYSGFGNQPYKVGNTTYKTDENGFFKLKADETAIFESLMENQYKLTEFAVDSFNGYSLANYDTRIIVDEDYNNSIFYGHDDVNNRQVLIDFESWDCNGNKTIATEKSVKYENSLAKLFDWRLIKTSTSKRTLKGAEFTLTSDLQGSKASYYGKSDENGIVVWYESINDRAKNKKHIEIPVGSYTLSETKAPGGYAKSEDVWHVVIDRQKGIQAYINKSGDLQEHTAIEQTKLNNGAVLTTVKFTFENEVAYTLPETGGRGLYPYTIGGVLLMLGAALLLYKNKKQIL